jgi:DNA-binding MarR family transcriptional regulator
MSSHDPAAVNAAVKLVGMRHRARAAELLGGLGLGLGQEAMLFELDAAGGRTQSQLACAASCEPPTVTAAVRKLEAAGLIDRVPAPHDARAIIVTLTDAGRALMPKLREAWQTLAEDTVRGLNDDERAEVVRLLGIVGDNLCPESRH